jgi:hypothetical protein
MKLSLPTVIHERAHNRFKPCAFPLRPVQNYGAENIMAIRVDVRLNHDLLAYRTFDGIFSAINFRRQILNDHASQNQSRFFEISFGGIHNNDSPSEKSH